MSNFLPNSRVATEEEVDERVRLECFFGRLKSLFGLVRNKCVLSNNVFDDYFNVACAICNIDIILRPLKREDGNNYKAILANMISEVEIQREKKRKSNEDYRRMKRVDEAIDNHLL